MKRLIFFLCLLLSLPALAGASGMEGTGGGIPGGTPNGIVKCNGSTCGGASAGTDYVVPSGSITGNAGGISGSGAVSISAGGSNQNITLTPSGSGITTTPNAIDAQGALYGLMPVVTVNGSDVTLTAQQCRGAVVVVLSSNKITIPSGLSTGASFSVRVRGTVTAKIVPPSGGRFDLNGTLTTADYILSSTGASGDTVGITFDGAYWVVEPSPGCPWTAGAT